MGSEPDVLRLGTRGHDKLCKKGTVTIRHKGRLHHIPIGRPYRGWRVIVLIAGLKSRSPAPAERNYAG